MFLFVFLSGFFDGLLDHFSFKEITLHLGALWNGELGDVVTELIPRQPLLLLAQLHANKIDEKLNFRLSNIDLLVQSLTETCFASRAVNDGLVTNFKHDFVLRHGKTHIFFFLVTFQGNVEEDKIWLGNELSF